MAGFLNPALSALGVTPAGAPPQQPDQGLPSLPQSQQTLEIPQVYQPQPPPSQQTAEIPQAHPPAGPRPPSLTGGTMPLNPRPELIQAMRTQESGGVQDPSRARGQAGEVGRMQVLPQTAAMYGVTPEQLRANPQLADRVGERYYTDLLRRYHGNEFLALVAYNSGPGRVDRGQLLPQSVKYATAILKRAPGSMLGGAAQQPQAQAEPPGQMPLQLSQNVPGGDQLAQQVQAPPSQPGVLSKAYQAAAEVSPEIAALGKLGTRLGETEQEARARYQRFATQSPEQQTRYDPQEAAGLKDIAVGAAGGLEAPEAEAPHPAVGLLRAADDLGALITGRQQQQQPEARLQQILKGQGPESMYGPLGAPPPEAMQAGELYSPRETKAMENIAMGGLGVEGEIPELSSAARAMVRRARQFGVDPAEIGPLAQRVREGTLTDRGLSQALQQLRKKLPETARTAAAIRGAGEELPRDLLAAISKAVRAGDITLQQAKKMLKAGVGGAALLPLIGLGAEEQPPAPAAAQPGQPSQLTPPGPQEQPGILQRMRQGLASGLEGTAYAGDVEDFNARHFGGAGAPSAPAAGPTTVPPMGVTSVNPMTGSMTLGQSALQVPNIDPAAQSSSLRVSPSGVSFTKTTRTTPPPATERQQVAGAMTALVQTMDAIKFYDANIQPNIKKYTGPAWSAGGRRGYEQDIGYEHSRLASLLGIQTDPDMKQFMAKLGPIQAGSLKGLSGGRVGIGIANFLGPHLPNPSKDDIPTLREKLEGLRQNLPIVIRTYNQMHGLGRSEDDIGAAIEKIPWRGGSAATATLPPEAKNWKTSQAVQYLMENYRMSQDDAVAWIRAHPEFH